MSTRRTKRHSHNQAAQRYEKQRRRNLLAEPGAHDFIIVLDHLKTGFNVPKIFRSAEAFGAKEIHLINIGMFDPAPGKGSFKKVPARFFESFDESYQHLINQGYEVFMMKAESSEALHQAELPKKAAFIFGHEEQGHSFDKSDYADIKSLSITQFGQVESLNVSVAASIVMYEYTRHWGGQFIEPSSSHLRENKIKRKKSLLL